LPAAPEPVLLGSAMLAAIASGLHPDAAAAMSAMSGEAMVFSPATGELRSLHAARYDAFRALQAAARALRASSAARRRPAERL
jgi:D-ribulokinase